MEVKVHAGTRRNQVGPVVAGRVRVSVTIAPEQGKANKEVIKLISGWANVPASSVSIATGLTNPRKTLGFDTSDPNELLKKLQKLLAMKDGS